MLHRGRCSVQKGAWYENGTIDIYRRVERGKMGVIIPWVAELPVRASESTYVRKDSEL